MTRPIHACFAFLSLFALAGCVPAVFVGAAETGSVVAQERTVGRAVDDFTLQTDLEARLLKEGFQLFRKVDTEVVEGRVLLTGRVPTQEARTAAGRIAWSVPHVREVLNEVEVEPKGRLGTYFNDLRISEQLRAKLLTDGEIAIVNYNVETVNGTIYLLGIAQNQQELERVALHARTIPGVKKVVSHVQLKNAPERAGF